MRVVVFGGTTEGRELVEFLAQNRIEVYVCVATEYGGSLLPQMPNVHVNAGRLDEEEIENYLSGLTPDYCMDATHPYAVLVTENVIKACKNTGTKYLRIERKIEAEPEYYREESTVQDGDRDARVLEKDGAKEEEPYVKYVNSIDEAVEFLKTTTGNIFITTGSKELEKYTAIPCYKERCVARVLPIPEVVIRCFELGFCGRNLICAQGPFSEELNHAMYDNYNAGWVVTKYTGREGGFISKCDAAVKAGAGIIVVRGSKKKVAGSFTLDEIKHLFSGMFEKQYYDSHVGRCREY